ncbi:hypothetical protein JK636_01985 [Clostridium sp. YIM B02515]|uniref:Uncharacterized protein n=1 Tax=Clostridium rhizosphaerae TaxID=2803861 RepID=A0ABS1T5B5_9CLOT|nr:hypothetical protein [Clostridium rhizosphaerae]MBL4934524.1 hypothetical protein [Clostridium rhizosphaerae]
MKKFISIAVLIMITIQSTVLYLFFNEKLSSYPTNIISIVWICSALLATLFGILFFRANKKIRTPIITIFSVALIGIIGFQFMLFKNWTIVFTLILFVFALHFFKYRDSKFIIFPVISLIMGVYSICLYLFMIGITSM